MLKPFLACGVSAFALTIPALAQSPDEPLVLETIEAAGLRPVEAADVTSAVTVLTAQDLAIRDAPYIADQLRSVPGLAVSRSGAIGGLTQVRIRGAEANHTLVFLDGIEVSNPNSGEIDFGLWSGLDAARIEVLRGEQSTLYGSDAVGGVIAIETRTDPGLRGLLEAGTEGTFRLDGRYGAEFDKGYLVASFADVITDGVDTSGTGGEKDGSQNYSVGLRGGLDLAADWSLTALARYGYATVDTDPDLDFDGRLDDADRVTDSEQWIVGATLEGDAFGLNHIVRANYNDITRENEADGALTNEASGQRTKLAYSPSLQFGRGDAVHTISGLLDYESEDYEASDVEFGGFTDQSQTFDTLGFAAEYQFSLNAFAFNASARRDDNDGQFDDADTWRLGAAYSFDAIGGRLRASAGEGVKNPTFTELFGFFPGNFIGNPDLVPEKSRSWELGWDQTFRAVDASVTYFSAELEDEIFTTFNPDFTSTARNRAGNSKRYGIEIGAGWQVSNALNVTGAFTATDSQDDGGSEEIRVPDWTGSLGLNWQPDPAGFRAGLAVDLVGDQSDFDFGAFPARRVDLDTYALVSATADIPVTERLSVTLRGTNLLDQDVTDVFGFNAPGAGALIGLRLR